MGESKVRVDSVEALKTLRTTLWKFAELCRSALNDAESEMQRTQVWLETEQPTYWQGQIRKRADIVGRAKEALRQKVVFKDATGARQSVVDEEKALRLAMQRLAEAEEKLVAVKKYARRLQKEISMYKGGVQRFTTSVEHELPVAASQLDRMAASLEAYIALVPTAAASPLSDALSAAGFALSEEELQAAPGVVVSPRQMTPAAEELAGAVAAQRPAAWVMEVVAAADLAALGALLAARTPPDPAARVVIGDDARAAKRLYLQRLASDQWFIGAADERAESCQATNVAAFSQERPDLAEPMSLPAGYVAVFDGGRIAAVFDEHDHDRLPELLPASGG